MLLYEYSSSKASKLRTCCSSPTPGGERADVSEGTGPRGGDAAEAEREGRAGQASPRRSRFSVYLLYYCFTSTKVQILTQKTRDKRRRAAAGSQFTCFTTALLVQKYRY
jgi:hypothetical protein